MNGNNILTKQGHEITYKNDIKYKKSKSIP